MKIRKSTPYAVVVDDVLDGYCNVWRRSWKLLGL